MRSLRRSSKYTVVSFLCAASLFCLAACGGDDDAADSALAVNEKFNTLDEMLANPQVQQLIAALPAGDGVGAGDYYRGTTPVDITGTYEASEVRGEPGTFENSGVLFGGRIGFDVVGPGLVEVINADDVLFSCDGSGSFIVGEGNQVTVFQQLTCLCLGQELSRQVSVDRFVVTFQGLEDYFRNAVALSVDPGGICQNPDMSSITDRPAFFEEIGS